MAKISYYTVDEEVLGERSADVRTNYGVDALGSVTSTIRGSGIENTYSYTPYGQQLQKTGASADPKFKWVGVFGYKSIERSFSEVYVRARAYSTAISRWTTVDPRWPSEPPFNYVRGGVTYTIDYEGTTPLQNPKNLCPTGLFVDKCTESTTTARHRRGCHSRVKLKGGPSMPGKRLDAAQNDCKLHCTMGPELQISTELGDCRDFGKEGFELRGWYPFHTVRTEKELKVDSYTILVEYRPVDIICSCECDVEITAYGNERDVCKIKHSVKPLPLKP